MRRYGSLSRVVVLLLLACSAPAHAEPRQINTLKELAAVLSACWKPPSREQANPIDITVIFAFKRDGSILGRPRITYESADATDNDRLAYRTAIMETLQRCTPLPLTEALGGAIAGRPFVLPFRKPKPRSDERRAWLQPKTL